jgi:hypothetical protein
MYMEFVFGWHAHVFMGMGKQIELTETNMLKRAMPVIEIT